MEASPRVLAGVQPGPGQVLLPIQWLLCLVFHQQAGEQKLITNADPQTLQHLQHLCLQGDGFALIWALWADADPTVSFQGKADRSLPRERLPSSQRALRTELLGWETRLRCSSVSWGFPRTEKRDSSPHPGTELLCCLCRP